MRLQRVFRAESTAVLDNAGTLLATRVLARLQPVGPSVRVPHSLDMIGDRALNQSNRLLNVIDLKQGCASTFLSVRDHKQVV